MDSKKNIVKRSQKNKLKPSKKLNKSADTGLLAASGVFWIAWIFTLISLRYGKKPLTYMKNFFIDGKSELINSANESIEKWKGLSLDQKINLLSTIKKSKVGVIILYPHSDCLGSNIKFDQNKFYGLITGILPGTSSYGGINEKRKKEIYLKHCSGLRQCFTVEELKHDKHGENIYDLTITTLEFYVKYFDYNVEQYKEEKINFHRIIPCLK